jgi:flavin-dependent dehydrogenase
MRLGADVIVIGGGPGGSAAAIQAATTGCSVLLVEQQTFPRQRPGETLHPGVQALFRQLGVLAAVEESCGLRHTAIDLDWGGRRERMHYAPPGEGPWAGYQIARDRLDVLLLDQARSLGVRILQPCRPRTVAFSDAGVVLQTSDGPLTSRILIDATGAAAWLARRLKLPVIRQSPPLQCRFGYCTAAAPSPASPPTLKGERSGWAWIAPISVTRIAWVRATWDGSEPRKPKPLAQAPDLGASRGANITWRRPATLAGPSFYICGDAAGVLDPCSSHGVLRAVMSGMMAAHQASQAIRARSSLSNVTAYQRWMDDWWQTDTAKLRELHAELHPIWAARPTVARAV